ncbi:MAG: cytochrome c [Legionella sp.]|nr:cytochrome c [Legionella sp.]
MLRRLITVAIALGFIGLAAFWFLTAPQTVPASALAAAHTVNLANGKTMFDAGGCVSCHTDSKEDRARLPGGVALKSPFGTFYTPNISSDPKDGIGAWNEAQFVTAMLKGTSPSGAHYYPSFPYTSYQRMAIGDLRDLFAYLKTLPPVAGRARDHDLPFPFNIRRTLGGWKLLFLDGKPFEPDASQSAEWNRGAYLVNGPSHCAECHSPRNALGGIVASQRFAGGPNTEGEGWVPNITQKGLGSWSVKDIAYLLETGSTPEFDSVGGSMAAVIRNTAQLSAADRNAMAVYLKSLAPVDGPPRPSKK